MSKKRGLASKKPGVIDLFSGAGGLALGFHAAGCHIQAAVDLDAVAARTFKHNFSVLQKERPPEVLWGNEQGDLESVDLASIVHDNYPDILIGGPPCQGFSRLGRAKLASLANEDAQDDPRNALYRRFLDAAATWKPRAVVMENVPGMLSLGGRNVADEVAADMADCGYRVGYSVLNASWYGVPQFRDRLFFIGIRTDLEIWPTMPRITHWTKQPVGYQRPLAECQPLLPFFSFRELAVLRTNGVKAATTVADALDDLSSFRDHLTGTQKGNLRGFRRYRRPAHSTYSTLMRNWPGLPASRKYDDYPPRRTPRDYEIFRRMKPGDRYPEALEIAAQLLGEELERRKKHGKEPRPESAAFRQLQKQIVPPYPVDMFLDKWRKLIPDQPSWTVPAHLSKDTYSHIHHDSQQARMISVREAARLQSFPDQFMFHGNMGDCYRQIGNAVPPLLAWAIGHAVLTALGLNSVPPVQV